MATHTLTLTTEQLGTLSTLVYMGEWLLNSHRSEPREDFQETVQLVFKAQHDAGETGNIVFDPESGSYEPSRTFDEEIYPLIEEYDEEMFWEEFVDRMALRDLLQHYTIEQLAAMPIEERIDLKQPLLMHYEDVFERFGLDCLQVGAEPPPPTQISFN